jgi:hypothetical protein
LRPYHRIHFHRHQFVADAEMNHIHHHYYGEPDPEVLDRLDAIFTRLGLMEKTIMAAIDDLKTAVGAFIQEGTSDIAALVAQINAQSNQDPAIVALTTQITGATTAMHTAFTGATGVVLPPPTTPPAA